MLEFSCQNCGALIAVRTGRGSEVICYNCNTRQQVPENARVAEPEPEREERRAPRTSELRSQLKARMTEPLYSATHTVATIVVVLGVVQCGLAVLLACAVSPYMLFGIAGGIITMAIGLGLHCLRNIAIDVWHMRKGMA